MPAPFSPEDFNDSVNAPFTTTSPYESLLPNTLAYPVIRPSADASASALIPTVICFVRTVAPFSYSDITTPIPLAACLRHHPSVTPDRPQSRSAEQLTHQLRHQREAYHATHEPRYESSKGHQQP